MQSHDYSDQFMARFERIRPPGPTPRGPSYKVDRRYRKKRSTPVVAGMQQRRNKHWMW